jgi:hypothetical protein
MTSLTVTIKHFASFNRAPGPTWTEATERKAPHKPLLLLAVLDLVHRGIITSPFIAITGDLVELNELFNVYWRRIIPSARPAASPFPSPASTGNRSGNKNTRSSSPFFTCTENTLKDNTNEQRPDQFSHNRE